MATFQSELFKAGTQANRPQGGMSESWSEAGRASPLIPDQKLIPEEEGLLEFGLTDSHQEIKVTTADTTR